MSGGPRGHTGARGHWHLRKYTRCVMLDVMRTTLTLDDDILARARELAEVSGRSIGAVISDMARESMTAQTRTATRNGIQLLPETNPGSAATLAEVNRLRDDTS